MLARVAAEEVPGLTQALEATGGPVRFWETVVDLLGDAVFLVGPDRRLLYWNRAAEQLTGYGRDEAVGQPCQKAIHCKVCEKQCGVFALGGMRDVPLVLEARDGRRLEVLKSATVLRSRDGAPLLGIEVLRDVTRRRREIEGYAYGSIISRSPKMQQVFELVDHVAKSGATILVQGDSGTGKELVAREIHRRSRRASGPFHAVSCAAIAPDLLESEFFGHERGAFTGAVTQKPGRFEVANGGSIFLDEVAELPLELQAKLLRVLEEHSFERVGGTKPIDVDVRVIAATHRDLAAMVAQGRFREDLYYRLRVVPLVLPPLRERREDIGILAEHFLARIAERDSSERRTLSAAALDLLLAHTWPGNVRELANVMEYAAVVARGPVVEIADLPIELRTQIAEKQSEPPDPVAEASASSELGQIEDERARIELALMRTRYSTGDAARLLGMHRTTLYRKRLRYGL